MNVHDVHCHFFSSPFFEALGREKRGGQAPIDADAVAQQLGWDPPGTAEALADRWTAELDRYGVSRAALIASVPGDEDSVARAVARHPDRFVGFFAVNLALPDALERARRAFAELQLRCACLFPAMHRYRLDDPRVPQLFELAATHGAALFVHCGFLSIEARTKMGLRQTLDPRLGDPLTLATTALDFPGVPVIVPHFGAGLLREALMAADLSRNILLDTSSSNAWVKYVPGLTLTETFRRALSTIGPERIVFGTDSSYFPRGWRRVIHGAQLTALDDLGVEADAREKIFGGNFDRIFPMR